MRRVYIFCKPCSNVIEKWACEHQLPSSSGRSAAPLATYYEGPNGEISIPGQGSDRLPKRLEKLGYSVKTVQDAHGYSQLMKRLDGDARRKYEAVQEANYEHFEREQKAQREELKRSMTTEFGRDFLKAAIAESQRRGYERNYSPGSYIEGFEYDRGHDHE